MDGKVTSYGMQPFRCSVRCNQPCNLPEFTLLQSSSDPESEESCILGCTWMYQAVKLHGKL